MWQDPTDVTRRKPRRLRGTPANKVVNLAATAIITSFCSFWYWYSRSEFEWVQRARRRVQERLKPREHEAIRRDMFIDPQFQLIVNHVNQRALDREYGELEGKEEPKPNL